MAIERVFDFGHVFELCASVVSEETRLETRSISNTGLQVSAIGLGGMPLSLERRPTETQGIQVLHAAWDAGTTLIDTADVYCIDDNDIGHNERLIRKALTTWSGERSKIVVATKGGLRRPGGDWVTDGRPEHLRSACERSLKALDCDSITLYQLHAPDRRVPFADSVATLAQLRQAGKIQHIGLSNVTVSEIQEAQRIVPIASVQNRFNPFDLSSSHEGVIAYCEKEGLAFFPYSPVGGGNGHVRVANHPLFKRLAVHYHASAYEIVLAWMLALSPNMIPIPGASRVQSAKSSAHAATIRLSPSHIQEIHQTLGLEPIQSIA